ncbi:TrkH family potassium uptake protein [Bacillus badius]|uniref:Potassium uptake protein, integral membrane component, KtrB n=1 Tax=Bacillus badius TaxID=1455 RepID=A0ABR5AX16_BACBA|nr:TrkH family potassium uptake protein [Bacillus badius]KIL74401.1 Potassium uptake protein, integral membrane component, KtrB [Bacillus badius]KIL78871.1 Potassium uptake protein, integral membrane component, KtrB [Bacillus badius]KZR58927.1 Trk family potassium uptake protein [Bacillus badius]MED4717393.1 TrkH family potassium uptake protein [Bacillus badius]
MVHSKSSHFMDPPKILAGGFALVILLGAYLLTLPVATADGEGLSFLNALFTATSATCVTGLVVVDTGSTFTLFGQLVILSLIQIGGLGFMSVATLFAFLLRRKISLKERLILREAFNSLAIEGIVKLVRRVLLFTLVCEFIGGTLLAIRFSFDMPAAKAIYFGFFHAISNFNNAGFDLMGDYRSLTGYVNDPVVVLVVCSLIILGGIGFVVMNELYEYRQKKQLSLHTKIVLVTTFLLVSVGAILIFLLELHNPKTLQPLSWPGKFLGSLYQSVTARTAGSNTLNIADLTDTTLFLIIFLMFIGASPGSTGGGIKTTTFATLVGAVISQIKGKEEVVFFERRIDYKLIYKSLTIILSSLSVIVIVTMILTITETGKGFLMIVFEATSAFATTGLSMGLTPDLTPIGKAVIIFAMFAGRLGPLTLAIALTLNRQPDRFRYTEEKIMIG